MAEHHHQSAVDLEIVCVNEVRNLLWENWWKSVPVCGHMTNVREQREKRESCLLGILQSSQGKIMANLTLVEETEGEGGRV